jgi:N-acyl-D-amino-acid deacylase
MHFDVLIAGGMVVDGTGKPGVRADVGVRGKEVAEVGDLSGGGPDLPQAQTADRVIDARGLVVAPGFIDVHAHSDGALLTDGQHANGIRQGITTEIIAPDGLTYPPLPADKYRLYRQYLSGILGLPPEDLDMSSIEAARRNYHGKTSCNVAMFLGHGPVRLNVLGMKDAPLRGKDLDRAKGLVKDNLAQGAAGFATGLSYYPQSYSDTDELVELCKVAAAAGKPLSIHTRDHNVERAVHGGGVEEALEIGRRSGVKVHVEHYRTQASNAGQVDKILEPIERAKRDGVDVTLETYPYPVGSSFPPAFFPAEWHEGGPAEILKRMSDQAVRRKYVDLLQAKPMRGGMGGNCWTWIGSAANKRLEGMQWEDVAKERGVTLVEMVWDVMFEEKMTCGFRGAPPASVRLWRQVEEDVMTLMARPDYMIGSDAIPVGGLPHPRAYGCFPRFVGRLRRRHGYPVEQAVQRVTQNPARRFGLTRRGVLQKGNFADIVVFDSERITDRSSFEDPKVHPEGVPYVLVNGKVAVDRERCTGVLAGEAVP